MATNKIHSNNAFAKRVKALGLTYVQLAKISGYNVRSLYNISCNHRELPAPLDAILKMLETEADRNNPKKG